MGLLNRPFFDHRVLTRVPRASASEALRGGAPSGGVGGHMHLETFYGPDRMAPVPSRVKAPLPTIGGVPSSLLPCWVAPAPHRLMCAVSYGQRRSSTHIIPLRGTALLRQRW